MKTQLTTLLSNKRSQVPPNTMEMSYTIAHGKAELSFRARIYAAVKKDRCHRAAECLPHELILQILGHLVPSVHTAAYRIPLDSSNFTESLASSATREVERSQRYLHWASQVCRDWHAVANELLYATPFLTNTRRLELFIRTLTEVPSLTRFVKDVYAQLSTKGTASNMLGWVLGRRSTKLQREELTALLES